MEALYKFRLRLYLYYKAGNPIILHNFNMSSIPCRVFMNF